MTPENMTIAQFMDAGTTGVATGKQTKMMAKQLYAKAKRLTGRPKRPSDHRDRGSCWPLMRLSRTQPVSVSRHVC